MKMNKFTDANVGVLTSADYKQKKYKFLYFGFCLYFIIYMLIVLVPFIWMFTFGFKEPAEIVSKTPKFLPENMDFSKISEVWNRYKIYKYYLNTFIMAAGSVVFCVVINGLAGYVLSRLRPRGSRFYLNMVFTLMLLPATVSMVPNYLLFKKIGMLNTYYPIWIMAGAGLFNILLFKSSFDGISNSLVEAAKIDGASNLRIFFQIIIPLSIPVIIVVSLFTFNGEFGNFFWPYLLINDSNKIVMGVRVFQIQNSMVTKDVQMIIAYLAIIPQIIMFALFQKQIVGGINIGGVKG